jgi:diguanylate cyclase (GGDEF)-like protein/PAS domain S-box-containing protein
LYHSKHFLLQHSAASLQFKADSRMIRESGFLARFMHASRRQALFLSLWFAAITAGCLLVDRLLPGAAWLLLLAATVSFFFGLQHFLLGVQRQQRVAEQLRLHNVLDALPISVFLEDAQGRFSFANRAFLQTADRETLTGLSVAEICSGLGLAHRGAAPDARFNWQIQRDGRALAYLCFEFPLCDGAGKPQGRGVVATDITEQLAAEEQLRLAQQVFDNASEGILMTDAQARIIAVNPAFTKITGYQADEAIGKVSRMFWGDHRADEVVQEIGSHLERDGFWRGEMLDRRKGGEFYPAWLSITGVHNRVGTLTHYVGVFSDFTARKAAESRLQFMAERDALTQLFNRSAFHQKMEAAVNNAGTHELALLFIDLDRFKHINDTLGHAIGDELLQVISLRLRHGLKQDDTIGRLGGDEFTVLIENPPSQKMLAEIAERIALELSRPCVVCGHELAVTCSIGIGRYPQDGRTASDLMRAADVAMYRAKEIGKNTYQFYANEMEQRHSETMLLEASLRTAILRGEFVLHYQPQYTLQGETLAGLEALVRWMHPELGMVPPASFIPLAEASGLIVPIGEWVLREACLQLASWRADGYDVPRVAVNLSATQVTRGELLPLVREILAETGIEPHRLELEITESMLMENQKDAVATLSALRDLGVRIAVDDFGTGYSSLANLKDYPIDCIKIDRHFVEQVPDDEDSNAIIEAIVALARRMQLQIVAEGIENEKQASFLRHSGCEIGQGYFYGRPQAGQFHTDVWQSGTSFEV